MFDVPSDAPFVWLALAVVSAAVLAAVLAMPTAPPPNAARLASGVDEVSATDHAAAAAVPIEADAVRIAPRRVGLRGPGGTAHAPLRFGAVVPVDPDGRLAAVLHGRPPGAVYRNSAEFYRALERARARDPEWRPVGDVVRVRRVRFGEVEGVLVGR